MKELSSLKALVEAKGKPKTERQAVDQYFNGLEDLVENVYEAMKKLRQGVESQVLTDMVKRLGMPATETKAMKMDMEQAWQAVRSMSEEFQDTYMAIAMAADKVDGNDD